MDDSQDYTILSRCLRAAVRERELVEDILQACKVSHISLSELCTWPEDEIAEKLFLTPEEASKFLRTCKTTADGDLRLLENAERQNEARPRRETAPASTETDEQVEKESDEAHIKIVERGMLKGIRRISGADVELSMCSSPRTEPSPRMGDRPEPKHSDLSEISIDSKQNSGAVAGIRGSSGRLRGARSAGDRAMIAALTKSEPSFRAPRKMHTLLNPGASAPSHMRPTDSYRRRCMSEVTEKPSVVRESLESRSLMSLGLSRLLIPTVSHSARLTATLKGDQYNEDGTKRVSNAERISACYSKVLSCPQGQRVTRAVPFRLRTDELESVPQLSTEDRELLKALKNRWKPLEIPKHIYTSHVPLGGRVNKIRSKSPPVICKPFQLRSVEKHEKCKQQRARQQAEERRREALMRNQRAIRMPKFDNVSPLRPRSAPKTTRSEAFQFSSDERLRRHRDVLDPARHARREQVAQERAAARARRVEELEEIVMSKQAKEQEAAKKAADEERAAAAFRKSLPQFKASPVRSCRPMSPLLPMQPTEPVGFQLNTDKRLGVSPGRCHRIDAALPTLKDFVKSLRAFGGNMRTSWPGPRAAHGLHTKAAPRSQHLAQRAAGLTSVDGLRLSSQALTP